MKYVLIIALWFVVLSNVLWAKSYVIQYEIYDDSNVTRVFEVKKELFKQFDALVDRVDNIYVGDLLKKKDFTIENCDVTYKDYVVTVVVGDGMGTYIHGELVQESCVVKPRGESIIMSLFE